MIGRRDDAPAGPPPGNPYAAAPGTAPVVTAPPAARPGVRPPSRPTPPLRESTPPAEPASSPGPVEARSAEQLERDRMDAELAAHRAALEQAMHPRSHRPTSRREARAAEARAAEGRAAEGRSRRSRPGPPATSPRTSSGPPAARPHPRMQARPGPALATLAVVLIGFGLVVLGGLRATTLAPKPTMDATLRNNSRVPVLSTAVGLLGLEGPRARVTARAASSSQTVFVGVGRAADVDAYLGSTARQELIGRNGRGQLLTRLAGTQPSVSDPAASDVWVVQTRARSAATLAWPRTPGQWRLVVASDGSAPAPATVTVTWSGRPTDTSAPVLIAVGVVLMVGGGVTLVMLSSRAGLTAGDEPQPAAPAAPATPADPRTGART